MQRLNNSISFKNNPSKKNHNFKLIKKSNINNIITPRSTKSKNKKNSTSILRNALLKKATEKIGESNKKTNLIKNKNKYLKKEVQNNVHNDNMNNMSNKKGKSNKTNNVTNNICIIIKTSENQEQKELKNDDYNFDYIDSIKISDNNNNNSHNQRSLITENINFKLKSNNLKDKKLGHNKIGKIKLKSQNNSFVLKKRHIRTQNNSIEKNNKINKKAKINIKSKQVNSKLNKYGNDNKNDHIKSRYKNDNFLTQKNSQRYKKRIIIPNIKNSNFGNCKNESGYSKEKYFTEISEKNIDRGLDNIMCSPIKSNKNVIGLSYKELIQQKKKFLGINFNIKEKKEDDELFINYDKEREEIEKKIKLNDERIKNDRKIINNRSQEESKRIFSSEISPNSNICNFFLDSKKINDKSNDSSKNIENIINNDNNISKSEISYIQTEINKEEIKNYINLIKPQNNYKTKNNSKKSKKKNINIKYKKRSIKKGKEKNSNKNKNRDSFNSINNIRNSINKLSKNNSGLLNSKSCIDVFIKESKMNKNINIILKDIKKIINRNKSDISKEANKAQKKPQKNIPKNEVLMIKDSEHGKTLHCIKKLSKDKIQEEIQIKTISSEKNAEEEEPKKITELLFNIKKKYKRKPKKDENKNLEIKIPGQEIQALRRIKSKIHDYKKTNQNQNKLKNNEYIKMQKYKSFSYFYLPKNNNKFINKYKIERANSLKVEYKNEKSIFHKLKFY